MLVNDLAAAVDFPRYGPKAVALGLGAQAAIQLFHNGERAGLNLYAHTAGAFDRSTVQLAELFANQGGALLGYADQVEQLSAALHTRTDIGTAVGILMERYGIDRHRAFAFLTRNSQNRNIKVRVLAQQIIDGTFRSTPAEDRESQTLALSPVQVLGCSGYMPAHRQERERRHVRTLGKSFQVSAHRSDGLGPAQLGRNPDKSSQIWGTAAEVHASAHRLRGRGQGHMDARESRSPAGIRTVRRAV